MRDGWQFYHKLRSRTGRQAPQPATAPSPGGTPRRHNPRMVYRPRALWRRLPRRAKLIVPLAVALVAAAIAVPVVMASGGTSGPCAGGQADDYTCWQDYFTGIVDKQGGEAALGEINAYRAVNSYVLANCHTLVHAIGRAALGHYGSINEASKHGDYTCWSGYFHGMYEQYMKKFTDEELFSVIPTICKRPPNDPYAFDYYNCLHGIGHGVTIRFGNDPFPALKYCDVFGEDWERTNCYTGVFMQNIVVDRQMHQSVRLKPDDPVYPCDAVDDAVQEGVLPHADVLHPPRLRLRLQEGLRDLRRHRRRVPRDLLHQHGPRHQRQFTSRRQEGRSSSAASATRSCRSGASSARHATRSSTTTAARTPTHSARSCRRASPSPASHRSRAPSTACETGRARFTSL